MRSKAAVDGDVRGLTCLIDCGSVTQRRVTETNAVDVYRDAFSSLTCSRSSEPQIHRVSKNKTHDFLIITSAIVDRFSEDLYWYLF